jgi:hypothetical protein
MESSQSPSRSVFSAPPPKKSQKKQVSSPAHSCSSSRSLSAAPPPKQNKADTPHGQPTCVRPKASDLNKVMRGVLDLAITDYRSRLATECPFPNETEEQTMAGAALACAWVEHSSQIESQETYDTLIELVSLIFVLRLSI